MREGGCSGRHRRDQTKSWSQTQSAGDEVQLRDWREKHNHGWQKQHESKKDAKRLKTRENFDGPHAHKCPTFLSP